MKSPVHEGVLEMHKRREIPLPVQGSLRNMVTAEMPKQHSDFFADLMYFPIGTNDAAGRIWATIICNPETEIIDASHMRIRVPYIPSGDPFVQSLLSKVDGVRYFAAVGVDFTNRRRNKVAGVIESFELTQDNTRMTLLLKTTENIGNCPKYITLRTLVAKARVPEPTITNGLDDYSLGLIQRCSTIFIVTKHTEGDCMSLGYNHRGGSRGFVRHYEEVSEHERVSYLVIPDYSGNRFYQSLGNVQADGFAGVVFPDFFSGDLLYVYGEAVNLFDEEASALMPRITLLTRVKVNSVFLIKQALQLEIVGGESFSPYNPPVRLLARELDFLAPADNAKATLVRVQKRSGLVDTFTFAISDSASFESFQFGGYGIFDFSSIFEKKYMHMNNANPKSVNDDLVRTWTISHYDREQRTISVTVKKAGLISSFLHSVADEYANNSFESPFEIPFRGFGGSFRCFEDKSQSDTIVKMLWIAGGIGITPFMSFAQQLKSLIPRLKADIILYFACRGDEADLVEEFATTGLFQITLFNASLEKNDWNDVKVERRRLNQSDFSAQLLQDREVFLCGPDTLTNDIKEWVGAERVHTENFAF